MFQPRSASRSSNTQLPIIPPPRKRRLLKRRRLFVFLSLCLLLLAVALGSGNSLIKPVYATSDGTQAGSTGGLTYQQFASEGHPKNVSHGPAVLPAYSRAHLKQSKGPFTDYSKLPPSTEPPTMKSVVLSLDAAFSTSGVSARPLDLLGSDGRMEVVIQPGTFDLSKATRVGGGAPQGSLTLHFSQISGHFVGWLNELGTYQLQLFDSQGNIVNGILLRTPITFIYHYQQAELNTLGLDAGHLLMTWPGLIAAAQKAHTSIAHFSIPLKNDKKAHTLTGESTVLDADVLKFGLSTPAVQSPPALHLASVQGNSGQYTYSYPLQVAPGPNGFVPQLALNYSSSGPNERHSLTSPAGDVGDGWSLSLGSISVETYPDGSTYYFLNNVAGVGDRLIPIGSTGFYATEHVSYLRIQQINPTSPGTCFHIWDKSGTYYELGCSPSQNVPDTSLQYWEDSNSNQHDYEWDVDKILAPNEGSGAGAYRLILVSYLQDFNSYYYLTQTVRSSAIEQITYGLSSDASTLATTVGTVDFHYLAPRANGPWADTYPYGVGYLCGQQPGGHPNNMRCDDPEQDQQSGSFNAPQVLSTLSLTSLTSYVGDDSAASHKAYRYDLVYNDSPYTTNNCTDSTGASGYCAGEHILTQITPSVYQYVNGQSQQHTLYGTTFGYASLQDTYSDSGQTVSGQMYHVITSWDYLTSYANSGTNEGVSITYAEGYNNAHGTPTDTNDDRFDPFYCPNHVNSQSNLQCTGIYAPYDDHAWGEEVVTQLQAKGSDASNQTPATVSYQYQLAFTGNHTSGNTWCEPDQNGSETECVGDNWLPPISDHDWQDYYHAEYQGFAKVWITSPAGDLTLDSYYSTDGWNTPLTNSNNFLGGALYDEQVYQGSGSKVSAFPLTDTSDSYATDTGACTNPTPASSPVYYSCEVVLTGTLVYDLEGANALELHEATSLTHSYTYDDYNGGWLAGGYHNLTQDQISGSNLQPSNASTIIYPVTKKWFYTYNNPSPQGSWIYYTVDKATHSEIDDHTGHTWQCQNITYDENTGNSLPAAGLPTTVQSYTNGCSSAITTYTAYDQYGNVLATVDGVGTALPSLYQGKGCSASLPTGAARGTTWSWSTQNATTCATYDSFFAQPITQTDAFNFTTNLTYDPTQGAALTNTVGPNGLSNTYTYSYDSSGNRTVQDLTSPDTTNYTNQSSTATSCTASSAIPCFEVDTITNLYNTVKGSTFYDAQGRAVETRTPGPGIYDTIVMTVYNDQNHSVWKSNPFEVAHGSGWIDPNGVKDRLSNPVYGTATFYDALGRAIATQDQSWGTGSDGLKCSSYLGTTNTYTTCLNYSLNQPNSIPGVSDANWELTATAVDADNHVTVNYIDALGRTSYVLNESGTLKGTRLQTVLYNALDKPTQITVEDLATTNTVTTNMGYNDLGWMTSLNDPDRGTHAYTYDPDGRVIVDAVGSRTLGYVYDLLGRLGCVQDVYPSSSPTGQCTGGNHLVQNTYDNSKLSVSGTTDYSQGQLTQSVALTVFPGGTSATTTELFEHDIRGQLLAEQMTVGNLPAAWNVTTQLPTYQVQNTYNDANQLTQTQTSANGVTGYITYPVYNSTNGWLNGIGKASGNSNLASYSYGVHTEVDDINFKTSSNGALLDDHFTYDKNLRVTSDAASWQAGSGSSGNTFTQNLTYDTASNLTTLVTTQASVSGVQNSGGSETQVFCYDEQNRLVWAGNSGTPSCGGTTAVSGSIAAYNNSFAYTNLGQLSTGPLAGSGSYQYLYCQGQPHELTGLYSSSSTCGNRSGAVYTSSYDAFGNVTSRAITLAQTTVTDTMNYDTLDRMTNWSSNASGQTQQEQYVYDASGNRVLRRSTSGPSTGPTTTITTYAFGLEEHTYTSAGASTGNLYYYFLGGKLIGSFDGTNTIFYLTDALGSVVSTFSNTSNTAAIKGNQLFGPYGVSGTARYQAGAINTAKGFTGQYNDALTGLDYYNARYYDPAVGVFLSADTAQGNAQGVNPYGYVGGNPETHNDPTGRYYTSPAPLYQGGTIAYALPGTGLITSITGDNNYSGSFQGVDGSQTLTSNGHLQIHTQTLTSAIDPYNPNTDAKNSPFAKLSRELGWSDLENVWGNPNSTWQDKLGAFFHFLGTNANNGLQFAMIFGGGPEGDAGGLLNELRASGAKFTESSIIGISRSAETGLLNWLEKGTDASGLTHILARHADDFVKVFGITAPEDVSKLILDTLGNQAPSDVNKTLRIFSDVSWGEFTHDLGIVVAANGYIVTAFPI